jgi:MFS family permease
MLHSGNSNAGVHVVEEENKSLSDRRVISSLTIGHIAQHIFAGAPILYQNIRDELGLNYTQIGIMAATTSILGGFGQMAYSIAARKFPRRLLLTLSNLFMSVGALFMGISFRFETLIVGNATAGVGTAAMHPISSSIISQKWEKKKIGLALSLFYGLGFAGNIIGPLLLSAIALEAGGWRVSYYFLAVVLLCCGSLGFILLRGESAAERSVSKKSDRRLVDDIKSALKVKEATLILLVQVFVSGGSGLRLRRFRSGCNEYVGSHVPQRSNEGSGIGRLDGGAGQFHRYERWGTRYDPFGKDS